MSTLRFRLLLALGALALSGCVAAPPQAAGTTRSSEPAASRTLVMIIRVEPDSVAAKPLLGAAGTTTTAQRRLFNAGLAISDSADAPQPYLAEALPQLYSQEWKVEPDGRMETIYRLRPGLTWHDGSALSANDFVFAWQVYATPEYGVARSAPLPLIEEVSGADDRTVVIRWTKPYPDANRLTHTQLQPLPRHVLEPAFVENPSDLPHHPFWSREYVGLGPYRLDRWEPGSWIEGRAFDGHATGRPKIPRVRLTFIPDQSTALANLLSGAAHISVDFSIRVEQVKTLRQDWGARSGGTILLSPSTLRITQIQRRPEYLRPHAVLDLRVRKALAYSIERDSLNDALLAGEGIIANSLIPLSSPAFNEVDRAVPKYPYDPSRAAQLMAEAGMVRGPDGVYTSPIEGPLNPELMVQTSAQSERELSIMAAGWRQFGFDVQERILPAALIGDNEARSTFRTLGNTGGGSLRSLRSAVIPGPNNRWSGSNRGAWSNPEFDRLYDAFETTLDPMQRMSQELEMARLANEDLAVIPLFFDVQPIPYVSTLRGPDSATNVGWNIQDWELD